VTVHIGEPLTFADVVAVAEGARVEIAAGVADKMAPARRMVQEAVAQGRTVYGITTGIGDLANVKIDTADAEDLQRDIVRSHAAGVGPSLPREVVRAMMLLKARTLAAGHSGARYDIVERLAQMLNERIHPVVPAQGSLGASGDLAPLAHLALPLIGEGEVEVGGKVEPAADALRAAAIEPLRLSHKEGISLVNGTEMMLSLGILTFERAVMLAVTADIAGAMSVEACLGTDRAFDEDLISLRRHRGARVVARNLRRILEGSEVVASHRHSEHLVQDAYSLRCIPQVHGAYRDGLAYVGEVLEAELGSVVDNPSVLFERGEVLSSGNFHGESLAVALDHLGLCAAGYATISERRTARLVDPDLSNGLPAFLTTSPGRRSGFMLAQYTAASLTGESRSLCFPSSSDSIPSSAGQEDHVSMGATSARHAAQVVSNTEHVIAVEILAAAQGLELRAPLAPAPATKAAVDEVRERAPFLDHDRPLSTDIAEVREMAAGGGLAAAVAAKTGPLE
jgi:histidine ammonia-lyase